MIAKAVMPSPWSHPALAKILALLFALVFIFIALVQLLTLIGLQASIYKQLTENIRTKNTAAASTGGMVCTVCGKKNPSSAKFCTECGGKTAPVATGGTACPACGKSNPPGTKFCSECGAKI